MRLMQPISESTIGIIGGKGGMGFFFNQLFENAGIDVLISDIDTNLSNVELTKRSDIVIVSVPIDKTLEVINQVSPYMTEEKLFMDVTSVKNVPVKAMLKSKADVIGMHPMFGPTIESIKKQTIILTPVRDTKGWQRSIESFFLDRDVNLKITTPEEHDKVMSLIQVLIHFSTICIGVTMSKLGFEIEETLEYTSPVYRLELFMVGSILAQSPRLYGNIPIYNPHTPWIIQEHKHTIEEISKLLINKDLKSFIQMFKKASDYFNKYTKTAIEEINYLITKLVEYNGKR